MIKLAVLGSGSGSNFQSILDAIDAGILDAEVRCVLSDVEDAYILERGRQHHIEACYVDHAPYKTKLDGDAQERVLEVIQQHEADVIVLAGYMRIVKRGLLDVFSQRVINIHPSLLPAFPGLTAWEQAAAYGVKVSGCTVHFVDAGMDTGPIILQKTVPVYDHDTPATLHHRIQEQEHVAYPEALQLLAENRLSIDGRLVRIDD